MGQRNPQGPEAQSVLDRMTSLDELAEEMQRDMNQGFNDIVNALESMDASVNIGGESEGGVGLFSEQFEPAFSIGEYVRLEPMGEVRQVELLDAQPSIGVTLDVNTNGRAVNQRLTEIEMPNHMLGQYRLANTGEIKPGTRIEVDKMGRNSMKFATKNDRGYYTSFTPDLTPTSNLTEMYQWEDGEIYFSVYEEAGESYENDELEVTFSGFSFLLTENEVDPGNETPTPVPVGPIRPDKRP